MRQRKPHAAELRDARIMRVDDAARDAKVCDGIAVEQQVALRVADQQREEAQHDARSGERKDLIARGR